MEVRVIKIDLTQTHDVVGTYLSMDWTDVKNKYHDDGTRYCFEVLDGKIMSGYLMKLSCFRNLMDLKETVK